MQSKTGYGDQGCRPLGARSTISHVLDCTNSLCRWNCKHYIQLKPCLKFFARLFFKKAAFPFTNSLVNHH